MGTTGVQVLSVDVLSVDVLPVRFLLWVCLPPGTEGSLIFLLFGVGEEQLAFSFPFDKGCCLGRGYGSDNGYWLGPDRWLPGS
ncbi:hypothetical protein L484_001788 [Morus notabilis]|uniref:Uncharacterized protein n=1 Tax=Morus notabilis TaxID=981085 RepID=W9RL01_9ROSA|nr:hypothetical protein L484_001788 [Morus notabilis]